MPINRAPFNALVDDDGSGVVGTVWNKTQIQSVLLDPIDALVGGLLPQGAAPWWTYTPSWSQIGGSVQPGLGNGTIAGRLATVGKTVHYALTWIAGSTTTFGDAYWAFGLPIGALTANSIIQNFGGVAVLIGASIQMGATLGYDGAHVNIVAPNGNYVGPTVPWAWAPGHTILLRGTYESV